MVGEAANPLDEFGSRLAAPHGLQPERGEPIAMLGDDGFNFTELVEVERVHQAGETARNSLGLEAGQKVAVECCGLAENGDEIPVVPAMVAAERHHVAAGRCTAAPAR